jgi:hypothetical protein
LARLEQGAPTDRFPQLTTAIRLECAVEFQQVHGG